MDARFWWNQASMRFSDGDRDSVILPLVLRDDGKELTSHLPSLSTHPPPGDLF